MSISVEIKGLDKVLDRLHQVSAYTAETYNWGRLIAGEAQTELEGATKTWHNRPSFWVHGERGAGSSAKLSVNVDPELPFGYVNAGTRPHAIFPKNAKALRFNTRFSAKSRPNSLRAYVGSSRPPVRFAMGVWHPGFPARNFTRLAAEKAARDGKRKVEQELQKVIEGLGGFWQRARYTLRGR